MDNKYLKLHELTPQKLAWVTREISESRTYELDDDSHIVVTGTNTRVGYIGDDTFELVNPEDPTLIQHHKNIISIYNTAIRGFFRDKGRRKGRNIDNLVSA